ncbi:MAG: hypothetical protein R2755_33045 [Acidimicrobiales bacterium]
MSVACYQLDANVGPPLEIVGPAGSFYSINGQFNTLLSANNGGAGDCTPPPCEAPNAPADMPAAPPPARTCRPPRPPPQRPPPCPPPLRR